MNMRQECVLVLRRANNLCTASRRREAILPFYVVKHIWSAVSTPQCKRQAGESAEKGNKDDSDCKIFPMVTPEEAVYLGNVCKYLMGQC